MSPNARGRGGQTEDVAEGVAAGAGARFRDPSADRGETFGSTGRKATWRVEHVSGRAGVKGRHAPYPGVRASTNTAYARALFFSVCDFAHYRIKWWRNWWKSGLTPRRNGAMMTSLRQDGRNIGRLKCQNKLRKRCVLVILAAAGYTPANGIGEPWMLRKDCLGFFFVGSVAR